MNMLFKIYSPVVPMSSCPVEAMSLYDIIISVVHDSIGTLYRPVRFACQCTMSTSAPTNFSACVLYVCMKLCCKETVEVGVVS